MQLGRYRHSKLGKEYEVVGIARHSESLEEMVVYRTLYGNPLGELWVRPRGMFTELVEINGEKVSRFVFIGV